MLTIFAVLTLIFEFSHLYADKSLDCFRFVILTGTSKQVELKLDDPFK